MDTIREPLLIVAAICVFGGMLTMIVYITVLIVRGGLGGEKPGGKEAEHELEAAAGRSREGVGHGR